MSTQLASTPLATASQAAWRNNPAWTQLLGLCPLLAVSVSVANAMGLALASTFVLLGSSALVAATRHIIAQHLRLPAYVLIIATFTTCAVMLMQAFAFELYERIALFVQIIVTNCMILGRAEAFASRNTVVRATADALGTAIGFAIAIITLGAVRELFGAGTLFAGTSELLGPLGSVAGLTILPEGVRLNIWRTPPGAFLAAGLLLAAGQWLLSSRSKTQTPKNPEEK